MTRMESSEEAPRTDIVTGIVSFSSFRCLYTPIFYNESQLNSNPFCPTSILNVLLRFHFTALLKAERRKLIDILFLPVV